MTELIVAGLTRLLAILLQLIVPALLRLQSTKRGRARMAQVYRLLRQAAHNDDADTIRGRYNIHPTARWGLGTWIGGSGEITICADTYLGRDCFVVSDPHGAKIQIGKQCAISHNVHIRTAGYEPDMPFEQARLSPAVSRDIQIGDFVWIGANVMVLGGVTVGANSILGANSVVTQDVEPNSIYGGVPAHLIRRKNKPAQETNPSA